MGSPIISAFQERVARTRANPLNPITGYKTIQAITVFIFRFQIEPHVRVSTFRQRYVRMFQQTSQNFSSRL